MNTALPTAAPATDEARRLDYLQRCWMDHGEGVGRPLVDTLPNGLGLCRDHYDQLMDECR